MGGWVGLVGACFDQSLIGQIVWWSNRLTTMVDEPWVGLVGSFECWPLATLRRAVAGPWRAVAPPRPPRQTIQPCPAGCAIAEAQNETRRDRRKGRAPGPGARAGERAAVFAWPRFDR